MKKSGYTYKGFDISNTYKTYKLQNEYSNPYGCNLYSSLREDCNKDYDISHTNQSSKRK